jgi:hypothetical protein
MEGGRTGRKLQAGCQTGPRGPAGGDANLLQGRDQPRQAYGATRSGWRSVKMRRSQLGLRHTNLRTVS